jgi:hypothetical protein
VDIASETNIGNAWSFTCTGTLTIRRNLWPRTDLIWAMPKHPEKLRVAIDRSAGRDKVSSSDPAAAPLGTDEEAAGTPVAPGDVATAAQHEIRGPSQPIREGHEPFFPTRTVLVIAGLLLLLAGLAAAYFR